MTYSAFRFRGGRLCLDFAATVVGRHREPEDQLTETTTGEWLVAAGLLSVAPQVRPEDVTQARQLREAVHRVVHPATRSTLNPADVGLLNYWACEEAPYPVLGPDGRSVARFAKKPVPSCFSAIARDAITLVCTDLDKVRECERPSCSVLFVDLSRSGRRRWCDMTRCGNQVKASRHRRRTAKDAVTG